MLVYILFLFGATATSALQKLSTSLPDAELKWSSRYTMNAVKMTLNSDLTEVIDVWRTPRRMRLDYNGGTVKKVYTKGRFLRKSFVYEVIPTTTEEVTNQIQCVKGTSGFPDDILPETYFMEFIGEEVLNGKETYVFYSAEKGEDVDNRKTIWASYDNDTSKWIPIKYETVDYNSWFGSLSEHIVWEYNNYVTSNISNEDFNIIDDSCELDYLDDRKDLTTDLVLIDPEESEHVDEVFNAFKSKYEKIYSHEIEHKIRKKIFRKNLRYVIAKNRQNLGFKLAINHFSDRTEDELKYLKNLKRRPVGDEEGKIQFPYTENVLDELAKTLPKDHDLRLYGQVTPVRNQDSCGSCWTFGTTAAVEGALSRKNGGRLIHLSNQALIDCAWGFGVDGCNGGFDVGAYKWIIKHGLPTEEEYGPYLNNDGLCHIENMTTTYQIRGYTDVTPYNVEALKAAVVNHGPLSVSVHVTEVFQAYSSGIFYDTTCNPTELNHEVTLVGYGESNGETYWILKNSWGPQWGVEGYMYISSRDNNCGVATEPTYVVF